MIIAISLTLGGAAALFATLHLQAANNRPNMEACSAALAYLKTGYAKRDRSWHLGVIPKSRYPSLVSLEHFKERNFEEFASRPELQALEKQILASHSNPFVQCSVLKEWVDAERLTVINNPDAVPFPLQDGHGVIEAIGVPIMHNNNVYFEYGSYCGGGCGRGGTIVMRRGQSGEWLVAEVLSKWLS